MCPEAFSKTSKQKIFCKPVHVLVMPRRSSPDYIYAYRYTNSSEVCFGAVLKDALLKIIRLEAF